MCEFNQVISNHFWLLMFVDNHFSGRTTCHPDQENPVLTGLITVTADNSFDLDHGLL